MWGEGPEGVTEGQVVQFPSWRGRGWEAEVGDGSERRGHQEEGHHPRMHPWTCTLVGVDGRGLMCRAGLGFWCFWRDAVRGEGQKVILSLFCDTYKGRHRLRGGAPPQAKVGDAVGVSCVVNPEVWVKALQIVHELPHELSIPSYNRHPAASVTQPPHNCARPFLSQASCWQGNTAFPPRRSTSAPLTRNMEKAQTTNRPHCQPSSGHERPTTCSLPNCSSPRPPLLTLAAVPKGSSADISCLNEVAHRQQGRSAAAVATAAIRTAAIRI